MVALTYPIVSRIAGISTPFTYADGVFFPIRPTVSHYVVNAPLLSTVSQSQPPIGLDPDSTRPAGFIARVDLPESA